MMERKRYAHSAGACNFHMQFTPKYRKNVFAIRAVRELCRVVIKEKAKKLGIEIEAIEYGPDYVHLFLSDCKNYSVAKIAQELKGYSSYKIRKNLGKTIRPFLWGDQFWSDGYFHESIGEITSETVEHYIKRQQEKHWQSKSTDLNETSRLGQQTLDYYT